ncbi:hydrogenase formation protein HypD [[Eubacterium] cellulosolvens]
MSQLMEFRDKTTADKIIKKLVSMDLNLTLMHVCGTHQDTIVKYGLDDLLKKHGVRIRQGPGCPVCVTTTSEIEMSLELAKKGKTIATFGDMLRVPGLKESLNDVRSQGGKVKIVYSITDAVNLAKKTDDDIVFVAIGFETTAPSTAITLLKGPPKNFFVLSFHRYLPPALNALLGMGEIKLQGIIEPGHVSTIIGMNAYEGVSYKYSIPQVIAGFEPLDVLMAVYMIAKQIHESKSIVENEYKRVVKKEGNLKALKAISEVFEPKDAKWRGFPKISLSKMAIKKEFESFDAEKQWTDELKSIMHNEFTEPKGCECHRVLRGLVEPKECTLFGETCNPNHPIGPCMVSIEGSCNIEYRYRRIIR